MEMFYLSTHLSFFIYGYLASDIIVNDHSDSERGNALSPLHSIFIYIHIKFSQTQQYVPLSFTYHEPLQTLNDKGQSKEQMMRMISV